MKTSMDAVIFFIFLYPLRVFYQMKLNIMQDLILFKIILRDICFSFINKKWGVVEKLFWLYNCRDSGFSCVLYISWRGRIKNEIRAAPL